MNLFNCISFNHRTAPVSIRERLIISPSDMKPLIAEDNESFVLCTCNRTEIYSSGVSENSIFVLLSGKSGINLEDLKKFSEAFSGAEAIRHLFMVASGLDSLILGEPQILGQVKEAYRLSVSVKTTSIYLNKAVHRAFRAAKRVRTETGIGTYPVSVASEAVELACHIFDDMKKSRVLIIGAGDMAGLVGKRLKEKGVKEITVINRTYENACLMAMELEGQARAYDTLKSELVNSDIIISSTGSCDPVITRDMMADVMKMRKNREVIIIDIAVPRDVEPETGKLYNCYLYDIDSLKLIVDKHFTKRLLQTDKAMEIINYEVDVFSSWLNSLTAQQTIKDLYNLIESYAKDQAQRISFKDQDRQALEDALVSGYKRLIHRPVSFLRDHPAAANIEYARRLFKLDDDHKDRHKGQ